MTSRQRLQAIIGGPGADRTGFWLGCPKAESWASYHRYFGTKSDEELRVKLGDDLRWITPQWTPSTYAKGAESLDVVYKFPKKAHGDPGPFANTESVQEVHDFLVSGQYLHMSQINPKAKKSHPDSYPKGPENSHGGWGHNPGFEGYGPIAMLTGQGALAYSLMHRCGIRIDREKHDAAYRFLKKGTGQNGYVW